MSRRKIRASSAGARLETHKKNSLFSESSSRETPEVAFGPIVISSVPKQHCPDWLERELLRKEPRRHSFTQGDGAKSSLGLRHRIDPDHTLYQIEQISFFNELNNLQKAFAESAKAGIIQLNFSQFRSVMKKCQNLRAIKDYQIKQLFMKIDHEDEGKIQWDEAQTFLLEEQAQRDRSVLREKKATFVLPASEIALRHGERVQRIRALPDGTVLTLSEDGDVGHWKSRLQLKKTKSVFQKRPPSRKPKWATDFVTMPELNKLLIATGNRELQFYDLSSLKPCCGFKELESVPINLDSCCTEPDECLIVYGDSQGFVNVILIKSIKDKLRLWKKVSQVEGVPSITINQSPDINFIRWRAHQDWVSMVKYCPSMFAVISSSTHKDSALVIGCIHPSTSHIQVCREEKKKGIESAKSRAQVCISTKQTLRIPLGVKCFDFCSRRQLLVTGGMDRLLRLWLPYTEDELGVLRGHTAPISYVCIATEEGHIFSVSTDNTAKIWHIEDKTCLFTARPEESGMEGEQSACLYSSALKGLYVSAGSLFLLLQQTTQQNDHRVSHKEPVLCCGYSEKFKEVVSCSEGSVVKVWDVRTGAEVFDFGSAVISCMAIDSSGCRLLTGGRDGSLKMWNFNNGQCLGKFSNGSSAEICDCLFLQMNNKKIVLSVGGSRNVDVYTVHTQDGFQNQAPNPSWQDDMENGHQQDILCAAFCPPHLLATGSYDGEILVWNMDLEKIQCRFKAPQSPQNISVHVQPLSVFNLVFLKRQESCSSVWLVSAGSEGYVNFWSVLEGGQLMTSLQCRFRHVITRLAVTSDQRTLFTADHMGIISVFSVRTFDLGPNQLPEQLNFWRAHTNSITGLQVIESDMFVISSSTDCSVRLWSIGGQFIGTFGQDEPWCTDCVSSWKHPAVPHEVLVDPFSMTCLTALQPKISSSLTLNSEETPSKQQGYTHTDPAKVFL